jgi:mannose-6-phosphate isomerase-like protein (cupin superfamily)
MKRTILGVLLGISMGGILTYSQSSTPASIKSKDATDITAAQIQAVLKLDSPDKNADRLVKVIDAGPYNVSMNVQHRIKGQVTDDQGALHTKVTEIYYVLDGSATLVTGGTMTNPKASVYDPKLITPDGGNSTGPGFSGKIMKPYVSRKVGPGDVVFMPPMTIHWFSSIDDHIDYLAFRVDNEHVLPAGYTHPVLRSAK